MAEVTQTTRAKLISQLEVKTKKAKPIVRELFLAELRRSTKPELQRLLKGVKVSRDGWNITL